MARVFLSHSSKDKKQYVEQVAISLGVNNCIYDNLTFEEGLKSLDEIFKGLDISDIFVIFISNSALDSKWVRTELGKAHDLAKTGNIKRIFPIIIDENIDHFDSRIPYWLRKEYNLKFISRPTVAARRIKQRMRELSWETYPIIKEREKIFVGRNESIRQFEERFNDYGKTTPLCFIAASGIENIGRKSLIRNCLKKVSVIDDSYEPPIISLNSKESLEDFILKINDLGLSSQINVKSLLKKKVSEKVEIAVNIISDIQKAKEIIFIIDKGCIVTPEGVMSNWFEEILDKIPNKVISFGIASSFRLPRSISKTNMNILAIDVPELDKNERSGLLKRYSDLENLSLSKEDFLFFLSLLNGLPEQIYFAVDTIKDYGLGKAKKNYIEIVDFANEKITKLLQRYEHDRSSFDFLCFLSKFDFIGYDLIFEVVGDEDYNRNLLNEFLAKGICEYLGVNHEYIRVNDAIRDYVMRSLYELPENYRQKLKEHLELFLKDYQSEERDIADILYSIKEALLQKKDIDEDYLIPSHFLKTMVDIYNNNRRYNDVIKLADRVLECSEYIEDNIKLEIKYYLCLSLARLQNDRFLKEIDAIEGADRSFLYGFYYRHMGNTVKALEHLNKALAQRSNFARAKRELVQVYIYLDDYETAIELARQNFIHDRTNPYYVQAYFRCLVNQEKTVEREKEIEDLLECLYKIRSDKGKEMYLEAKAQFLAYYKNDLSEALSYINMGIQKFPDSIYLKFTKCNICERFNQNSDMKSTLDTIEKDFNKSSYYYNYFICLKATYLAKNGSTLNALSLIDKNLKNYPENAILKIKQKIQKYANHKK